MEIDDETQSQVVWVSSSALVDDETSQRVAGGNQDFYPQLHQLDVRAGGEHLHPRQEPQLRVSDHGQRHRLQLSLLITGVLPLGYFACGIVIWVRRKRR